LSPCIFFGFVGTFKNLNSMRIIPGYWDVKPIQRFFGSQKSADLAAAKRNKQNGTDNLLVFPFGPLFYVGTKQQFKEL
jgi:hypothetical protein